MNSEHGTSETDDSSVVSQTNVPGSGNIRILAGFASLAIAGLLISVGILIRGPGGVARNPTSDPAGFVRLVTSTAFTVWMLTTVASVPLRMYGFLALYAYLADTDVERISLAALILSLTSMVLFAHVLGVPHFVWPEVGNLYQAGQEEVFQLAGFPGASRILFLIASVVGLIGLVSFGVAIWQSGRLPKGAAVLFVLHVLPLNLGFLGFQFEAVGGFMLFLSAVWFIAAAVRETPVESRGELIGGEDR